MAKDAVTVILGVIYTSVIALSKIISIIMDPGIDAIFLTLFPGFQVVSVVFYLIFVHSTKGSKFAYLGFAFGVPEWVSGLTFQIYFLFWQPYSTLIESLFLSLNIAQVVIGYLLFARRDKWQTPGPPCPECNWATKYVAEYRKFFCDSCKKYS